MAYQLSPTVRHAVADGQNIFLDIARDQYFALPDRRIEAFNRLATGGKVLSRHRDDLSYLVNMGVLIEAPGPWIKADDIPRATMTILDERKSDDAQALLTIGSACRIWREKIRHRQSALSAFLEHLDRFDVLDSVTSERAVLRRHACAFRQAAYLTRAREHCLPCSIALAIALRQRGVPARFIMGVSGKPFAAHCWVQVDQLIVNDVLDHISPFTPILIR